MRARHCVADDCDDPGSRSDYANCRFCKKHKAIVLPYVRGEFATMNVKCLAPDCPRPLVFGNSVCHFHLYTKLPPAVPEPTREEIEAAVDASLIELAAQELIESATLLKLGVTSQPITYKRAERTLGATRFFPLIKFPSKRTASSAHMYLVIRGLTDAVMRPKVVNVQGGGYNICDGDDDVVPH
jgi:hypothetical protein